MAGGCEAEVLLGFDEDDTLRRFPYLLLLRIDCYRLVQSTTTSSYASLTPSETVQRMR